MGRPALWRLGKASRRGSLWSIKGSLPGHESEKVVWERSRGGGEWTWIPNGGREAALEVAGAGP